MSNKIKSSISSILSNPERLNNQIIEKLKKIIYLHIYKGTYLINMQAYKAFQSIFHYY